MKFTDIFIRRPILAISISLLIVLMGLFSMTKMQVREYPTMINTVATVTTNYYGADSALMEGFITQPLEQAIAQVDNIDFMTSSSTAGKSVITAYMKLNTDPDATTASILSKINSVSYKLPKESETPTIDISTGSTTDLVYISFSSEVLNSSELNDYLRRVVEPQFYTISGVAQVSLYGGIDFGMRVWLKPDSMAALDISTQEVYNVISKNNFQSSPGQLNNSLNVLNTSINTQVTSVDELKELIIKEKDGNIVKLNDIAEVSLEKSHDFYRALGNNEEAVVVAIKTTPTANPLEVIKGVNTLLPEIEKELPSAINVKIIYDSTVAIESSIKEVIKTIGEAGLIVLIVIALFLGNFRAVLIPVITIPLSLIGVCIIMASLGFSINLMTLLAMVLAIGLVVDDAIVVVENVQRHMSENKASAFDAAIYGTREIAVPVISMTLALGAVYSPIALMGGLTGSLFTEFALTLAGSVFVSGVVALTLSPVMCAYFFKDNKHSKLEDFSNNLLNKLSVKYKSSLKATFDNKGAVYLFAFIVFATMPSLFNGISSELAPKEDKGVFVMQITGPNSANLDYMQKNASSVGQTLNGHKDIDGFVSMVGVPNPNQGLIITNLKNWDEREKSQDEIINEIKDKNKDLANVTAVPFSMPELPGASSGLPIQLIVSTPNKREQLYSVIKNIEDKVLATGLFVYNDVDLAYDTGKLKIEIDRDKAGAYGITMDSIGHTISTMVTDGYLNRVAIDGRAYEVILQTERDLRQNPDLINNYYVKSGSGEMVPLSELISYEVISEPRLLPKFNQLNSANLSLVAAPTVTMGDAISAIENILNEELPKGYMHDYLGEARQFTSEGDSLYVTFGLALIVIFLILAIQFESVRDPLVIIMSVPLAISGALIVLAWGVSTLNIYSQIGLVTLIGLITKHGILICEVAKENQLHHGMNKYDSIIEAAALRLRAILMTAISMIAGLIPLLYATGAGAESRFSIGIVIVFGLAIGTIFTLYVLPTIYLKFGEEHKPLKEINESYKAN
jgi:multidrug efflux pump